MNTDTNIENTTDFLLLGFLLFFLATFLDIRHLFTDTIVTGGDMASWYGVAHHMLTVLLPEGRLTGWDMGNFSGYPNFSFYFIPPFLLAVLPSYLFDIPLTITLKVAIAAGVFALPVSTYAGLRAMDYRFPAPIAGAYGTLLFLFNETYTMFGGNVLSTYAGEFCYMFAFALLPWFMGSLYRGVETGRGAVKNGLLLGLIGLSHLFVFIPAAYLMVYWYFARGRLGYLVRVTLLGFGIMAFWILPLIVHRHPYTVPVYIVWNEFLNWRYTLAGVGLVTLVATPHIALTVLGRRDHLEIPVGARGMASSPYGQTIRCRIPYGLILTTGMLTFLGVYFAGQYLVLGTDIWFSGMDLPDPVNAPLGPKTAGMIAPWIVPVSLLLTGAVCSALGFLDTDVRVRAFGRGLAFCAYVALAFLSMVGLHRIITGILTVDSPWAFLRQAPLAVPISGVAALTTGYLLFLSETGRAAVQRIAEGKERHIFGMYLSLVFGCAVTYFAGHFLRIPDIRFLPPVLFVLILVLFAHLLGRILGHCRMVSRILGVVAIGLLCLVTVVFGTRLSGFWFRYNNSGYEATPGYGDFMEAADYLRAEGGNAPLNAPRVGYEKCDCYGAYGGDRAFESIPVFSGRQTLEGVHYTSSIAASFIAFLQTEFSRDIKTPNAAILSRINPEALKVHLNLYNVSQIVAMTDQLKQALGGSGVFRRERRFGDISIYRYLESDGRYVDVPDVRPVVYTGGNWPQAFYQWFKRPEQPQVLLVPDAFIRDGADRSVFAGYTGDLLNLDRFAHDALDRKDLAIDEHVEHLKIRFTTNRVGVPHLIKVSYFPNWRVTGANGIYPVSPHFMMVVPRQNTVEIVYGRTVWEVMGWGITGLTVVSMILVWIPRRMRRRGAARLPARIGGALSWTEGRLLQSRRHQLAVLFPAAIILSLSGAMLRSRPVRTFLDGMAHYQAGSRLSEAHQVDAAERAFEDAIREWDSLLGDRGTVGHRDIINCMLYTAACYERLGRRDSAVGWYRALIAEYPYCRQLGEAYVKMARIGMQEGNSRVKSGLRQVADGVYSDGVGAIGQGIRQMEEGIDGLRTAIERDPYSVWVTHAQRDLALVEADLEAIKPMILSVVEEADYPPFIPPSIDRNQTREVILHLDAASGWLDTRLEVVAGETVRIGTEGVWAAAPEAVQDTWPDTGAAGHGSHPAEAAFRHLDSQKELPGAAFGSLLGRVGDRIFVIGDLDALVIPQSGRLLLVINDLPDHRSDNRGGLDIRIRFGYDRGGRLVNGR